MTKFCKDLRERRRKKKKKKNYNSQKVYYICKKEF